MSLKLTTDAETDLYREIQNLLDELADAWDPTEGVTAEVSNKLLEKASEISDRLRYLEVTEP